MLILLFFILGLAFGLKVAAFFGRRKNPFFSKLLEKESLVPPSPLEEKIWFEEEDNFLINLNEELSFNLTRDMVAKCVVENAHNFLSAGKSILLLLDENNKEFRIEYALGLDRYISDSFSLKKEDSVSGFVISSRQPLLVNDWDQQPYLKRINKEAYFGKSFMSVPLYWENVVFGVLHICENKSDTPFTKRDLAALTSAGRVASNAFHSSYLNEQIQSDYLKTIAALALAIDAKDSSTRWHSDNVTRYSLAIAKEMNCSYYEIEVLRRAALLHDIGKIGIKDSILQKKDKLDKEEFEEIKLHPLKGEDIIKSLSFLKDSSLLIRHHHERFDGLGYPDGIKDYKIELGARILAVADCFDAIVSDRPYRKARTFDEALSELEQNKGTQFDPIVVESFLRVLRQDGTILNRSGDLNL